MSIEEFPEMEAFNKLPRRVIVKGGISTVGQQGNAELSGIVINNLGTPIKDLRVNLIIFDSREIPVHNATAAPDPAHLPQGGIASFKFSVDDHSEKITNFYLYPTWQYDDSQWS